jgi:DNA-binding HxlR family transcriptional regulator
MRSSIVERTFEEVLDERFREFKALVAAWSKETISMAKPFLDPDPPENTRLNLMVARTIGNKWSIEILTVLSASKSVGFGELRKALRGISPRVLSRKLTIMEKSGLILRNILDRKPPRVHYALTEKGVTLTTLGAPVILYLRFKEGLYGPRWTARRNHNRRESNNAMCPSSKSEPNLLPVGAIDEEV